MFIICIACYARFDFNRGCVIKCICIIEIDCVLFFVKGFAFVDGCIAFELTFLCERLRIIEIDCARY